MKHEHTRRKLMIAGVVAAATFAVAGFSASAQTTTTTTTTSIATAGVLTTAAGTPTSATPEMIQEACQRSKARADKFLKFGIPEQWGSEEPFTFDPNKQC